jgi:hypothetical protein
LFSGRCGHAAAVGVLLLVLALAVLLFVVGFAAKVLWIPAAIILVLWLIGFAARGEGARWFRW